MVLSFPLRLVTTKASATLRLTTANSFGLIGVVHYIASLPTKGSPPPNIVSIPSLEDKRIWKVTKTTSALAHELNHSSFQATWPISHKDEY
jgi:hypothetical protein